MVMSKAEIKFWRELIADLKKQYGKEARQTLTESAVKPVERECSNTGVCGMCRSGPCRYASGPSKPSETWRTGELGALPPA